MTTSENTSDLKKCPFCAEMIKAKARLCKFCKAELDIEVPAPAQPRARETATSTSSQETFSNPSKPQQSSLMVPIISVFALAALVGVGFASNFLLNKPHEEPPPAVAVNSRTNAEVSQPSPAVNDSSETQPIKIGESVKFDTLTIEVESILRRTKIGEHTAPPGCKYIIVHLNFLNTGMRTTDISSDLFQIVTDDGTHYESDTGAKMALTSELLRSAEERSFLKFQANPGVQAQSVSVFLLPNEQLDKHPTLVTDNFSIKLPLWPERDQQSKWQIQAAEREKESASQSASQAPPMPNPFFKPNNNSPKAADATSAAPQPGNTDASVEPIATIVKRIIQAERSSDFTTSDKGRKELDALPKPSAGDDVAADSLNKDGVKALNSKEYTKAVELLASAAKTNPSVAKYFSNLGFSEMYAHDLPSAEKHTYQSLALNPDRVVAWNNLGQIYAKKGNQDDAVSCFLVAYRLSKGQSLPYLKSLDADDDQVIRAAGKAALSKIPSPVEQPVSSPASTTNSSMQSGVAASANRVSAATFDSAAKAAYLADLQRRIKRSWFPPKGIESHRMEVVFKVHSDGQMTNLKMVTSSGVALADQAAMKAVENAAPFRPLPSGAPEDIEVSFAFDFNAFSGGGNATLR